MRKLLITTVILSIAGFASGQITFTGDASVDFNNPLTVWAYDPCGEGDVNITWGMYYAGVLSGWDILKIGFYYDRANDVMYIGWDYNGRICGDADGDGNPSGQSYMEPNKHDIANLGNGETICMWIDTDNSGGSEGGDVVLGVGKYVTAANYAVTYENAGYGNPSNSFGDPIPEAAGSYLYNAPTGPDAAHRDFECTINNYSQMPCVDLANRMYDEVSFGIHIYSGSWEDGCIGYDKFTNSCWLIVTIPGVDIPPDPPADLTHNYPRDLYVLEGIPMTVEDGDPPTLFGPPFSTNPAGWPYWRVSRWDTENQTYIRYGEPDYPIDLGLDPPEQQPGMGFWVVQDCEDTCQIEITGFFHQPGDTVRIPLQSAIPSGEPGKNMLANPFDVPLTWGDCLIQRADHSQPPMSIEEAYTTGISCHYSAIWDAYNKQYIVKDLEDTFAPWQGFWTCVWDSLYDWEIIYVYPAETDNLTGLIVNAKPHYTDDVNDWSMFLGVSVDAIHLVDQCNYLGITSASSDVWDANDAPEMAPMVSSGGYVHLYFPHQDWSYRPNNYCFDFRQGPFEGTKVWNFDVRSFNYEGEVLLVWDGVAQLSPHYTVTLLDEAGNILVEDMINTDVLPLTIMEDEILHFQLRVERSTQGVGGGPGGALQDFELSKAYPNPFNSTVNLQFSLPHAAKVKISLYDVSGRLMKEAVNTQYSTGTHSLTIDFTNNSSGIYFLKAEADGRLFGQEKLVLVK